MAIPPEVLLRPWATLRDGNRCAIASGTEVCVEVADAVALFHGPDTKLAGRRYQPVVDLSVALDHQRHASFSAIPFPASPSAGLDLQVGDAALRVRWPHAPARPPASLEPATSDERRAVAAMARLQRVVARIQDVRAALDDPARLWERVSEAWSRADDEAEPDRDMIVRHARDMRRIMHELATRPRRVLRRAPAMVPVARVQEMDRAAMLWLTRQPGRTMAERAGPAQRVLAPARMSSANTLENRVVRSLAELSRHVAREYCRRNRKASQSTRFRSVAAYGRQCGRVAHALEESGVGTAPPGVVPNYVLSHDPLYLKAWTAYQELLRREREREELWAWQARSWEEFCALAVVVALWRLPGAALVAAAPVVFREDQQSGSWLDFDNPLAVFHLAAVDLVVEVQVRQPKHRDLDRLFAPVWLRVANLTNEFSRRAAIWPLHGFGEDAVAGDADEVLEVVRGSPRQHSLVAGAVIRPADHGSDAHRRESGGRSALSLTLGPSAQALHDGLDSLGRFCADLVRAGAS